MITKDFSGGELDTLIALVERGPVEDGDIPSKVGRDKLLSLGFAIQTAVKGQYGFQVATPKGIDAYTRYFEAETIGQAIEKRKAARNT